MIVVYSGATLTNNLDGSLDGTLVVMDGANFINTGTKRETASTWESLITSAQGAPVGASTFTAITLNADVMKNTVGIHDIRGARKSLWNGGNNGYTISVDESCAHPDGFAVSLTDGAQVKLENLTLKNVGYTPFFHVHSGTLLLGENVTFSTTDDGLHYIHLNCPTIFNDEGGNLIVDSTPSGTINIYVNQLEAFDSERHEQHVPEGTIVATAGDNITLSLDNFRLVEKVYDPDTGTPSKQLVAQDNKTEWGQYLVLSNDKKSIILKTMYWPVLANESISSTGMSDSKLSDLTVTATVTDQFGKEIEGSWTWVDENDNDISDIAVQAATEYIAKFVPIQGARSEFYEIPLTVYVTPVLKSVVEISGITVENKTYDGNPVTINGNPIFTSNGSEVTTSGYNYAWSKADGTKLDEAPKDAGNYKLTVSVASSDPNYVGTLERLFTISKSGITVAAKNQNIYVGGWAPDLSNPEPGTHYTMSGLAGGDTLDGTITMEYQAGGAAVTPDTSKSGSYDIVISGADIPNSTNYSGITFISSTLTISTQPGSGGNDSGTGGTTNSSGTGTNSGTGGTTDSSGTGTNSGTGGTTDSSGTGTNSGTGGTTDNSGTDTSHGTGNTTDSSATDTNSGTGGTTDGSGTGTSFGTGGTTDSSATGKMAEETVAVIVPLSGDDNTIHVGASVTGSTAVIDEAALSDLQTVIGDHVENVGVVTIDFSVLSREVDTVELSEDIVKQIAKAVNNPKNDTESLEIIFTDGSSIEFDDKVLGENSKLVDGFDIKISIKRAENDDLNLSQRETVGDRLAYHINVTRGGVHISDIGGMVTIHVPYRLQESEKAERIVVYHVDDNGNREACETSYDSEKHRLNWKTDHLSIYMIGYDEEKVSPEAEKIIEEKAQEQETEEIDVKDKASEEANENGSFWSVILIILLSLVILIGVWFFLIRKRKKEEENLSMRMDA